MPLPRTEDLRARAAEAERMANLALDPGLKDGYLKLAQSWRDLAEQAEATEQRAPRG